MSVTCTATQPSGAQTTVGEMFTLNCHGEMPGRLTDAVQIVFPEHDKQKHTLKVSKVLQNNSGNTVASEIVLEVYSHVPGSYQEQKFILTDGVTKYDVQNVQWQIASVIQPGDQMNPPYGGMERSYPLWFWLSIAAAIVVIIGVVAYFQRRWRLRRQLILAVLGEGREAIPFRELVKQQNAQAYTQFSRDFRAVQKKLSGGVGASAKAEPKEIWNEFEKIFRFYLVRELLTPAFAWSRRQLMADIKTHHRRVYTHVLRDLQQTLQELEKGRDQQVTMHDCEQLSQQVRRTAERIYELRVNEAKRRSAE